MALRAARSAVKTDLLLFAGGDQRFCLFPERAVAHPATPSSRSTPNNLTTPFTRPTNDRTTPALANHISAVRQVRAGINPPVAVIEPAATLLFVPDRRRGPCGPWRHRPERGPQHARQRVLIHSRRPGGFQPAPGAGRQPRDQLLGSAHPVRSSNGGDYDRIKVGHHDDVGWIIDR
jgi:hypothetical protein